MTDPQPLITAPPHPHKFGPCRRQFWWIWVKTCTVAGCGYRVRC